MSDMLQNPRSCCSLGGAFASIARVDGLIPIYHTGPGCGIQTSSGGGFPVNLGGSGLPCSNMFEREVVFGGVEKLRNTIKGTFEVMDGEAFFVLTGCTAGIIADDVESLVQEFREEGKKIYFLETAGFKGDDLLGHDIFINSFATSLVQPAKEKQADLVNLFGIVPGHELMWAGNIEEITRLLGKLGLRVNSFFTPGEGLSSIESSSAAALNIIISPWLAPKVERQYAEKFDVKSLRYPGTPIGPTATSDFLRQIGAALELDHNLVEKVILEEERKVYAYLDAASGMITRYRIAVVGDTNTVLGIMRFLVNDYCQIPVVAIITDYVYSDKLKDRIGEYFTKFEYGQPPAVHFEQDQYKIREILSEYDVTMLLGSSYDKETAHDIDALFVNVSAPSTDRVILNRSYAGYRGAITLIEDTYYNY